MKRALITGSFDPPTRGHLDLIKRTAALFDRVTVCIFINSEKKYMFSLEKRTEMLIAMCREVPNVRVDSFGGLVADYAKKIKADVIVKGARSGADFEYEATISRVNCTVFPVETVILPTDPTLSHISSTSARDMIRYGGDLEAFLTPEVIELI